MDLVIGTLDEMRSRNPLRFARAMYKHWPRIKALLEKGMTLESQLRLTGTDTHVIDLGKHLAEGNRVLSGREKGRRVRALENIDKLENLPIKIIFSHPSDVFAITTSFWLGLLQPSVERFEEEEFKSRFKLIGDGDGWEQQYFDRIFDFEFRMKHWPRHSV